MAGLIDALQALGQNLLARGFNTPFLHSPATYMCVRSTVVLMCVCGCGLNLTDPHHYSRVSTPHPIHTHSLSAQNQTKRYRDLAAAREGVRALGEEIAQGEGLPPEVGPVVFAFTGRGKVAQGAWVGMGRYGWVGRGGGIDATTGAGQPWQ